MRYALLAASLLFAGAGMVHAQINPNTQIKWPPCGPGAAFYNIVTNTCVVGGGGGGGSSPNPPNYSIQYAVGLFFGSDPTITVDPVKHNINVGTPNTNPKFTLQALGTIAAPWTEDITSPQTAINSLTGAGTETYVWTWHLGISSWQPPNPGGLTSITPGTGISCTPFVSGTCVGAVTINVTAGGNSFGAISSGTNSAAVMIVTTGASLTPSGSGKIQATHTTLTGALQCLEAAAVDGAFVGVGQPCNAFGALTSGTNNGGIMHIGTGASLDYLGAGSINASAIDGVTVTGTPTTGQVPTATGPTTATWQNQNAGTGLTAGTNGYYTIDVNGVIDEDVNTGALNNNTPTNVTLPHSIPTTFASCVCSDNGSRVQSGNDQAVGCNVSGLSAPYTHIIVNTPASSMSAYCRVRGK